MAKMRRQRLLLNKNAYPGCLAGFVSIFDFRQGHSTRSLISDHRQKNVGPPLAPSGDRKKPTTSIQKHEPAAERASIGNTCSQDEEESRAMATLDTVMITSVKALMEEDQWSKVLKPKKKLSDFVLKQIKQNLVLHEAYWKSSKKDKKSEMVGQIFPLIEEFCNGNIYCRFLLSNQDNLRKQLHLKSSVLRERLREALEVFLSNKYVEAYELDIVGATQPPDALMNAIQVMHTHKDFILRIIQDSSSILFKHIQGLQNAQADKACQTDSRKELSTPSLLDGWIINRGLLEKCVSQKPKGSNLKLFGQKNKKKNEKICSISDDSSHQIVILKPCQSSTESRPSDEKTRMKLKSAIQEGRKERHWLFVGNIPCNNNISDSANLHSMSRTNYTSALANVKGDKDSMPKDRQSLEQDSIFYTEVRKKLLEILKEDDEENLISMNDHKMLGRIISSPDNTNYCYKFIPPGSKELSSQTACPSSCESTQSNPANYALPLKTEVSSPEKVGDLNTESDPVIEINSVEDAARESDQTEVDDIRGMKTSISEQSNNIIGAQRECDESSVTDNSDQEVTVRSDEIVVEKINSMLVQPALFSASFIQTDGTDSEDKITEKPEKLSLNSVLEPFSSEDDANPANSPDKIDKLHILPQMVHIEEDDSFIHDSTSLIDVCPRNNGEEKDAMFGYIKNLLFASGLNCNEIEVTWQSTYAPLDPSLMDQVVAPSSQIPEYRKLLFDCVNEVLLESYIHLFGCCPWLSFVKRGIHPIPTGQQFMEKVAEIVASYLVVHQGLNQTVEKDMAKNKLWMDLRFDAEDVAFQIGHSILDKLMEETILELWD